MTNYTEDEEEEEAYNLRRRGLQLVTSTDCTRIDKNYLTEFNGQSLIIIDMPATLNQTSSSSSEYPRFEI